MILFFHFMCLLAQYLVSNISKSISKNKVEGDGVCKDDSFDCQTTVCSTGKKSGSQHSVYQEGTLKFFPPVYIQRYEAVALILEEFASRGKAKKVIDFGCAELGFFMYLKNIQGIREVLEVDIDVEKLQRNSYKAAPLTSDYLMSKCGNPLDVYIFAGSIGDYDDHLAGADVVIGIEVIEHLTEDILNQVPTNVFNNIKPRLAIFTTPNAEFNSLFPNFTDLRHNDHKFEWTRKEFYSWTQKITRQYPDYFVRFFGIGTGPEGTENLGCCTQMAVFQKLEDLEIIDSTKEKLDGIHNYTLLHHFEYPVFDDKRSTEEKIIHEIQYQVSHIVTLPEFYNYEENECEIPLTLLNEFVTDLCSDVEELRTILGKNGMKLKLKDGEWHLIYPEPGCSSDNSFEEDDSFVEEIDKNELGREEMTLNESWDLDEEFVQADEANCFLSARSVEPLLLDDSSMTEAKIDLVSVPTDVTKSARDRFNQLLEQFALADESYDYSQIFTENFPREKNPMKSKFSLKNFENPHSPPDFAQETYSPHKLDLPHNGY